MPTTTSPPILIWQPDGGTPPGEVAIPRPPITNGALTQLIVGQAYIDVTFDTEQVDNTWIFLACEVLNTTDLNPLNIWPGIITVKTSTGFRLYLNGLPDSSNYFLNWAISGINIPPPEPFPATTYRLAGPATGGLHVESSVFTVALPPGGTVAGSLTVTPHCAAGGAFTPSSVTLTTAAPSATFTYNSNSYGARTISVTNDGGLTDPVSLAFTCVTTGYSLIGPPSGAVGVPSTDFTVELPTLGVVIGTVVVTPNDSSGGGTFTPTTVNLTTVAPSATFTYTPASSGAKTISVTNNGGLTDPGSTTYTVAAFDPTTIAGLKLWLKADAIAGPPTDGTLLSAWNDSSGTGYNLGNAGGSERPTFKTAIVNGKPVVRFDGVANRLYAPAPNVVNQPDTIFVVGNSTTLNDCRWIHSAGGLQLFGLDSTGGYIEIYAGAGGGFLHSGSPVDQHGAFHQWTAIFNSTASSIYADGSLVVTGDAGTNAISQVCLMTDALNNTIHSVGDIAEILIYNSALGTTDRTNVQGYLKAKYNTP